MAWDKARLLQKLRESYEYYYDIDDGDGGSGLPLVYRAVFHVRSEGCTPHLDEETVGRCMDYALEDGLPRIVPDSEHRESYIIALFVADVIDKEAANAIRSRKYYRSFRLGLWGWAALRTAAVGLEKELIVTNKAGNSLVNFFRKLLRSEKV